MKVYVRTINLCGCLRQAMKPEAWVRSTYLRSHGHKPIYHPEWLLKSIRCMHLFAPGVSSIFCIICP